MCVTLWNVTMANILLAMGVFQANANPTYLSRRPIPDHDLVRLPGAEPRGRVRAACGHPLPSPVGGADDPDADVVAASTVRADPGGPAQGDRPRRRRGSDAGERVGCGGPACGGPAERGRGRRRPAPDDVVGLWVRPDGDVVRCVRNQVDQGHLGRPRGGLERETFGGEGARRLGSNAGACEFRC